MACSLDLSAKSLKDVGHKKKVRNKTLKISKKCGTLTFSIHYPIEESKIAFNMSNLFLLQQLLYINCLIKNKPIIAIFIV